MSWTYDCAKDNHADCPDTKEDKYECDCPCHLSLEVAPDDYVSEDGNTWYQSGKLVVAVGDNEDAETKLMAHANKEEYWPNAWLVSDHGNAHLVDYSKKEK